ncbi:hypothetical protein CDAR_278151 [Caerostris darwini]|uniref:Adult-specific rigid cuticular protein 15.7 n=1 Tax=Caerostris darwini TaxID=1538125 RepID=A0AAV4WRP9_9ARAC|nr:hypothetical protein CDAR_278151 [Caerostris darwini]
MKGYLDNEEEIRALLDYLHLVCEMSTSRKYFSKVVSAWTNASRVFSGAVAIHDSSSPNRYITILGVDLESSIRETSLLSTIRVAILFAALAAVHANVLLGHDHLVNTGVSTSARTQDAFGNNAFGYTIKDGLGATNSRSEVGDGYGNRKGSYTITDIDGRARRVDYVADGHGFRATVKTNEPGTAASAPAAALINSPYAGPVAPVVNYVAAAAPVVAAPFAVAAPVAYGGVIGHGAAVGYGAPLGLGYGAGVGFGYGAGLGLGLGKGLIH